MGAGRRVAPGPPVTLGRRRTEGWVAPRSEGIPVFRGACVRTPQGQVLGHEASCEFDPNALSHSDRSLTPRAPLQSSSDRP